MIFKAQNNPENKKYLLLLYGAIIGIAFDILFYNKTLGISYIIFIVMILLTLVLFFLGDLKKLNNYAWFFTIPILLLSSAFFIFSNQVLKIINYLIIPLLIIMLVTLAAKVNKSDWSDIRFAGDIVKRIFVPFRFIHRPFTELSNKTGDDDKNYRSRTLPKVIIGLLISIPILAIILWLLSSADIVFKNLFINMPAMKILKHSLIIIFVSVYAICFFWTLLKAFNERKEIVSNKKQWRLFLDPVVLLTILILINVVYTIFSVIQFTYLFGGDSFILPSDFTYAEYARRGFAELIVVTIINFGILIFGITFVKKESNRTFTVIKSFLTLLVIFTFILLISAFYRMLVYEQAYGFTYLRIFVQTFMIMMFFLFIINIIYIWYAKLPIIKSYFIISLSIYIIMNFANVDTIIAKNNINRYYETGEIDIVYLNGLSYDAIPDMQSFYTSIKNSTDPEEKQMAEDILKNFEEKKSELINQKSWQSYNISKYEAEKIIDQELQ